MRNMKTLGYFALAVMLAIGIAATAVAQVQTGLVNVNLEDVRVDIAKNIKVDVSQVPVTVQAPIGIAANVCNVAANVLADQIKQEGTANCRAVTTSTALNEIVQRQIKKG
jgi:hypothetical protein